MNHTVPINPAEREPEPTTSDWFSALGVKPVDVVADETVVAPAPVHIIHRSAAYCGTRLADIPLGDATGDARHVTCPACLDVLGRASSPLAPATLVDGQLAEPARPPLTDEQMDAAIGVLAKAIDAGLIDAPAAPERRTVSVEVLTDELLREAGLKREDGNVGVVLRLDGALCGVDKTDEPWIERPAPRKLIDLLRHAETVAASVIDPTQAAELLMPGADVLAALEGKPVGNFTAPVESRWGIVQPGWWVSVETGEPDQPVEWALVDDRTECHDPICVVRGGSPSWACAVATVQGRGVQHLDAFRSVYVRIPASSAVER